jgi:hypothetical protein
MEDAQNELYNISLEGANNYAQKYYSTVQEMYEKLTELAEQYRNGEFESEEAYNTAVKEAKEYYYERLKQYSSLYNIAIEADTNAMKDHILGTGDAMEGELGTNTSNIGAKWKEVMNGMINDVETLSSDATRYVELVDGAFEDWKTTCQEISTMTIGVNLREDLTLTGVEVDYLGEQMGGLGADAINLRGLLWTLSEEGVNELHGDLGDLIF